MSIAFSPATPQRFQEICALYQDVIRDMHARGLKPVSYTHLDVYKRQGPKTEDSHRKQYLTTPLLDELRGRLARIEENKAFFREEYRDYGLLMCQTDGRPVDPKNLEKSFKEHQKRIGIPENERIDFQGLRKSGQMHKVRLSQNNYQLVAENAGQSPEVLMNHYNEALDYE